MFFYIFSMENEKRETEKGMQFGGQLEEYLTSTHRYSKPLKERELKQYFNYLKQGTISADYLLVPKNEELIQRLDKNHIIINHREIKFESEINKQIQSAKKLKILYRFCKNKDHLDIKLTSGSTIDYNIANIVGGPSKRIDVLEPKTLYLKLRNEKASEARDKLICSNLRFVTKTASNYSASRYYLEDLVLQGTLGLIQAVDKYDLESGNKFTTYAKDWISQSIGQFLQKTSSNFKINSELYAKMGYIRKIEQEFTDKNSRVPSQEELFEKIDALQKAGVYYQKDKKITKKNIADYLRLQDLDITPIESNEDGKINFDVGVHMKDYDRVIDNETMNQLFEKLSSKEREILAKRHGIGDYDEHSLKELGKQYGLTRERVRQMIIEIKDKLNSFAG